MGKKHKQNGFSAIELIIILVVLGVVGFIGWRLLDSNNSVTAPADNNDTSSSAFIEWSFNGEAWQAMGSVPVCEDPLAIGAPMDITKASNVLLPGQIRGGDFKPHGGLGINDAADNKLTIKTIRNAYLYRGARYVEQGEVQYLLDFMDSCGVMFRFDHLATLTDEFMGYVNKLPEPMVDDSRTHKFEDHPFTPKGTIVATEVGFVEPRNVFFDLGVYDLRTQNEASKTELYKTDNLRIGDKEQSFYAICWLNMLEGSEKTAVQALPPRNANENTSDYCD